MRSLKVFFLEYGTVDIHWKKEESKSCTLVLMALQATKVFLFHTRWSILSRVDSTKLSGQETVPVSICFVDKTNSKVSEK